MRLRASLHCVFSTLMCFLNERCESHHSPRNFVDSSTGRSVFPILTIGGLSARDRGAVKCMTLHLWAANLKPFLVAHSCYCVPVMHYKVKNYRMARLCICYTSTIEAVTKWLPLGKWQFYIRFVKFKYGHFYFNLTEVSSIGCDEQGANIGSEHSGKPLSEPMVETCIIV